MAHHRIVLKVNEREWNLRDLIEGKKTKGSVYAHPGDIVPSFGLADKLLS
jgi:hypothetical protein